MYSYLDSLILFSRKFWITKIFIKRIIRYFGIFKHHQGASIQHFVCRVDGLYCKIPQLNTPLSVNISQLGHLLPIRTYFACGPCVRQAELIAHSCLFFSFKDTKKLTCHKTIWVSSVTYLHMLSWRVITCQSVHFIWTPQLVQIFAFGWKMSILMQMEEKHALINYEIIKCFNLIYYKLIHFN